MIRHVVVGRLRSTDDPAQAAADAARLEAGVVEIARVQIEVTDH